MLKSSARLTAALLGAAVLIAAQDASAHAYLKASRPAAHTVVTAPRAIVLQMSETLLPKFSGIDVSAGGAPIALRVNIVRDRMMGVPIEPLRAGVYQVKWHAATADLHRREGMFAFTVR